MSIGPDGALYVAEAGRGGSGACVPAGDGPEQCYGATGAITRVNLKNGRTRQIVKRLPSIAVQGGDTPGADSTGPHDVSWTRAGVGYFLVGLAADPAVRGQLGSAGRRFAGLYRLGRNGKVRKVADLGAHEAAKDPDKGRPTAVVDTNPFSLDASIGRRILVTDAGGNTLLRVNRRGSVRTVAVFPFATTDAPPFLGLPPGAKVPYQPVPTGVVRGNGGRAFVGELTGFPFPAGAANVFRVSGSGGTPAVFASGFTNVVDLARGRDGSLYVLQMTSLGLLAGPDNNPGRLIRIAPDGTRTELAAEQLQQPTGLAVTRRGDVYVANKGGSPDDAEIVHIHAAG
jgi:hypothetical protein